MGVRINEAGRHRHPARRNFPARAAVHLSHRHDAIAGDCNLAAITRVTAGLFARQGHPAWVYSFNQAAPGSDPVKVGAFHCAELVYVFGTQHTVDRPWEAIDRQLSDVMSSYWVRFAATGNPNGPDLPEWPAYDEQSRHVKEFGSRVSVGPGLEAAPLFEAFLSSRLPPVKQ